MASQKNELQLPEGAAEYLTLSNPRLQELKKRYAQFQKSVRVSIVWTDDYVELLGLHSFRGDNCYVWQSSDPNCAEINYSLTAYYVQSIDHIQFFVKNSEDGLFGAITHGMDDKLISRDLLDSANELSFLEKHLGLSDMSTFNMLDIGAGYGRLACRTACTFENLGLYLCTDAVPESTFLSEYHIRSRGVEEKVKVIPLDKIETQLQQQQIDLAVNIHSFSECSLEAIEWWLALVAANNVKHLFIVPNGSDHGGERLALNDGDDFSCIVEKYGYQLVVRAPKYGDPLVQKYGISPTFYYLFKLVDAAKS